MTPSRIVAEATSKGLSIIGICDHNSAENLSVAKKVAGEKGIHLIAGMEVTSSEEVHILALFDRIENVMTLQEIVYANLSGVENDERASGYQGVVNENDEILNFNKRLLIGATSLSVQNIVDVIRSLEGLAIASHIDRKPLGNMTETLMALIAGNPEIDFLYKHVRDNNSYIFDSRKIKRNLKGIPINTPDTLISIRMEIEKGLKSLG